MLDKLRSLNPLVVWFLSLALLSLSVYLINSPELESLGFITLFTALFLLFEGLGYQLFVKILIALALGVVLSLFGFFEQGKLAVIRPVGSKIFMNCLTMALVPLVFSSILTGITSLGDIKKLNRIGLRTIIYYVLTTAVAIIIGLSYANIWQPGSNLSEETKEVFVNDLKQAAEGQVEAADRNRQTLFEGLQSIFPKNIMETVSASGPNMLQLIFFAVICGIALLSIEREKARPVIRFFEGVSEMTIRLVIMVMRIAPYGVFALIASQISATQNTELLIELVPYSICVIMALITHVLILNTVSLKFLSKFSPIEFFKKTKEVMLTAFSTSSSGATMPFTLETVEEKLGVKNEVGGFVIPLGATINMDGTALWQGVSAIFLANIYGIDLTLGNQITIVLLVVAASIGTAAVPGVGIVMLTLVLVEVGIPPEGILFILPVNNLLDMFRTTVNVAGDMACSVYINSVEHGV
jgi:Na+/H+-dicarboxylate symporter